MSTQTNSALSNYKDYGYNSEIEYANPHRLIQMLFEGALKRVACAKGAIQRKDIAEKGKLISQSIEIVGGLRASLDIEKGGEIAANLESLYEYINRQLVTANLKNSEEILNEVSGLLRDVKQGWDAINVHTGEQTEQAGEASNKMDVEDNASKASSPIEKVELKQDDQRTQPVNARTSRALKAYSS